MCVATGTERKTFGACLCLFLFFFSASLSSSSRVQEGKTRRSNCTKNSQGCLMGPSPCFILLFYSPLLSFFLCFLGGKSLVVLLAESKLVCTRGPTASGERELEKRANAKGARWEYQVWSSGRSPGGEDSPLSRFFFLPRARMICEHWVF